MVIGKIKGIHKYRRPLKDGRFRYYYKVAREKGAPVFWTRDGHPEPEPVSQAFITAYEEKRAEWGEQAPLLADTISSLITRHRSTDEFKALSKSTRAYYEEAYPHILKEFGADEIAVFEDPNIRRDVKQWRRKWQHTPRQADKILGTLVTLLNFAVDEGDIARHVLSGIKRLHKYDRSHIIWTQDEIEAFQADATHVLRWFIGLASMTGLRREDIITIPANADKKSHLSWTTSKSRHKTQVTIPITAGLRLLLDEIKAFKKDKGITTTTLLINSRGKPWTGRGLSASFRKHKAKHNIEKRIHDLRGTAVTHFRASGLNPDEIADIVGWKKEDVEKIIKLYIDKETVIKATIQRLEKNSS